MNWLKKGLIVGGLAGVLLTGCKKEEVVEEPETPETPVVPENPKVEPIYENVDKLSKEELNSISLLSDDSIYFASPKDFKKGDILIGGISEKTPGGILRKISNVSGGGKRVSTTSATLEEVIQEGEFSINKKLLPWDLEEGSDLKSAKDYNFHYPIEKSVIFDLDGNQNTTNDQITVEGNVYFDLDYGFNANFKKGVKVVDFSTIIKQNAELVFEGNLDKYVDEEINLYKQSFVPFVIPTPYGLPLVLRPKLELNAGVVGEIHGKAISKINEDFISIGEISYLNGSWVSSNKLEKAFGAEFIEANANSKLKGYVSPRLDLVINEIAGPFAKSEGYLEIDVDTKNNPWWELYGGAKVSAGIDMGLFSKFIPDYEKELIDYKKLICQSDGGLSIINTAPKANFSVSPQNGMIGTQFSFDASSSNDEEDSTNNLFYRWDFDGDGSWEINWTKGRTIENYIYQKEGFYSPTLQVRDSEGLTDLFSKQIEVNKNEEFGHSKFVDSRDGQEYDIVNINGKWWFGENVNYYTRNSKYPENDSLKNHSYGRLYNWEDANKACPEGWKIPTKTEWYSMMKSLDSSVEYGEWYSGKDIGNILKENGIEHWKWPNGGIDKIGFSIVGAGRDIGSRTDWLKEQARLWTSSTDYTMDNSKVGINFEYNSSQVGTVPVPEKYFISLRFVKK